MNENNRIIVVDALRGFALLGIVLIHFVEHFDFFMKPEYNFLFTPSTDDLVMSAVFFLISGKAYSIFALMFGLSFFIQLNRKEEKGIDFRGRFFWRLCVLLCFGFLHSLLYKGDILHIYALLGMVLILFYKASTKVLTLFIVLFFLQIPMIFQLMQSFINPDYQFVRTFGEGLWQQADTTYSSGNLFEVAGFNLWQGRTTVWGWTFYNGRYLQLIALFLFGLLLGRKKVFEQIDNIKPYLVKILVLSILLFALFAFLYKSISISNLNDTQKSLITNIVSSYANLAFTLFLICSFLLLFVYHKNHFIFNYLASYGRMSLSNYLFQAIGGVILFYGFGFGLYRYIGPTWSILLGFFVFLIQLRISKIWLNYFYYGPMEWLWRALTYFDFSLKFRKKSQLKYSV